jgi:hypothetical protein
MKNSEVPKMTLRRAVECGLILEASATQAPDKNTPDSSDGGRTGGRRH